VKDAERAGDSWRRFVARQPILDRDDRLVAYELLFRTGFESSFRCDSADRASSSVIADALLVHGIADLAQGRKAFVNVSREVLLGDLATLLPREHVVIELLETVKPDADVIDACTRLKRSGYVLALDDFVYAPEYEPLLALADIVKVDFLATPRPARMDLARVLARRGIDLLAEKVESRDEHAWGVAAGYTYFQGYYFARPETVVGRDVPASKLLCLDLLRAVNAPDPDLEELAAEIQRDAALCYKLLRYVNSAMLGLRVAVHSVAHAIALLGLAEVRKWVSLLAMASLGADKPAALLASALERARCCELLAEPFGLDASRADLFLLGLFSHLDAMLDRPLAEAIAALPLDPAVRAALLEGAGPLRAPWACVLAIEAGDWGALARAAGTPERELAAAEAHRAALAWAMEAQAIAS
jgi:EAL and modified HD-GYP domain-containing signal transduction protein